MSSAAQTTSAPSEMPRRYSASGPFGFVEAVRHALLIAGKTYPLTMQVPKWYTAGSGAEVSGAGAYAQGVVTGPDAGLATAPKVVGALQPVIVWDVEMYPARRRKSTGAGAGGSGRLRDPLDFGTSTQPLPVGLSGEDDALETQGAGRRHILEPGQAPMWESIEDVPDLFRDELVTVGTDGVARIDPDAVVDVSGYVWDVFVHFVVLGPQEFDVMRIATELNEILLTSFHRAKMASEISGWPYQFRTGALGQIAGQIEPGVAATTISWQLRQMVAYGAPASYVDRIAVEVHGRAPGGNGVRIGPAATPS